MRITVNIDSNAVNIQYCMVKRVLTMILLDDLCCLFSSKVMLNSLLFAMFIFSVCVGSTWDKRIFVAPLFIIRLLKFRLFFYSP